MRRIFLIAFFLVLIVVYSLGNLVFDGAPGLPAWNRGNLFEVNLGRTGNRAASFRLIPIRLDAHGFPHSADNNGATAGILPRYFFR